MLFHKWMWEVSYKTLMYLSFLSLTPKINSCLAEEALILNALTIVLAVSDTVVAYIIMKNDFTYQDIS